MTTPGWDPELDGKTSGHYSTRLVQLPDGTWQVTAADGTEMLCDSYEEARGVMRAWMEGEESSPAWVPGYEANVRPKEA